MTQLKTDTANGLYYENPVGTPTTIDMFELNTGLSTVSQQIASFELNDYPNATYPSGPFASFFETSNTQTILANLDNSETLVRQISEAQSIANFNAKDNAELAERTLNNLEQQFLDESSVNLDEEMVYLIQLQQSYSASARMVNVIDEMFDTLLNSA